MILDELYLQNFCLYRGLHKFSLAPQKEKGLVKPITLFGGMNGAGKTTVLDAIQLALYGSRAKSAGRLGKPYEEYLKECVHRGANAEEGASVSVKFHFHSEGQQHVYEVWRGWSLRDKNVRERVRVTKDDAPDDFLSEHWNDVVEDLVPLGISQLFFFDAEKIRFLADDETDTEALGTAIKSLLGLDLAERLISDAAIVERRLTDTALDHGSDERISQLQQALESKSAELTDVKAKRASLENPLLRSRNVLEEAKKAFQSAGGEHWARRAELHVEIQDVERRIAEAQSRLREAACGELPLLLVRDMIARTMQRDDRERRAKTDAALSKVLSDRDKKLLRDAKREKVSEKAIEVIRKLLDTDRSQRTSDADTKLVLNLSGQTSSTLTRLLQKDLDMLESDAGKNLRYLKSLETDRERLLRLINAVPDDDTIARHVEIVKSAAESLGSLEGEAARLDDRIDQLRRERDDLDRKHLDLRQAAVKQTSERNDNLRMAALAGRTQTTMKEFLRRSTAQKIERLSVLVTESFAFLIRKHSLVDRVQIHPESFSIDLYDDRGNIVPKGRLSEGEKQIFAIALLWGLAKASPRQLPAIIDTPMARLDSEHRGFLVDRYFPNASHQVVILSTDTEIEKGYFESLRPRLARSYHLRYDEDERATNVEDGYFWAASKGANE